MGVTFTSENERNKVMCMYGGTLLLALDWKADSNQRIEVFETFT